MRARARAGRLTAQRTCPATEARFSRTPRRPTLQRQTTPGRAPATAAPSLLLAVRVGVMLLGAHAVPPTSVRVRLATQSGSPTGVGASPVRLMVSMNPGEGPVRGLALL